MNSERAIEELSDAIDRPKLFCYSKNINNHHKYMLTYTVELIPQKEGGYTVTAPALPGCISEGDTAEEALKNIRDAIEGYIKSLIEHGRKVPLEFSELRQIDVFKHPSKQKLNSNSCYT